MKIFGACGEVMKIGSGFDPKEHTFIQRSWDYNQDSKKHPIASAYLILTVCCFYLSYVSLFLFF